jgi:hypothetical protein
MLDVKGPRPLKCPISRSYVYWTRQIENIKRDRFVEFYVCREMKLVSKCGKPTPLLDRKYPRDGVKKVRVTECSGFSMLEVIINLMV